MVDNRLGEILVSQGVLNEEQIESVLSHARQYGLRLGQALVLEKQCSEEQLADALALKFNLERIDLTGLQVDPALVARVRRKNIERLNIIPVSVQEMGGREILTVATAHPENLMQIDELRAALGTLVDTRVATESQIAELVAAVLGQDGASTSADMGNVDIVFQQFTRREEETLILIENHRPRACNLSGIPDSTALSAAAILRLLTRDGLGNEMEQYDALTAKDFEKYLAAALPPDKVDHCRRMGGIQHLLQDSGGGFCRLTVLNYHPPEVGSNRSAELTYCLRFDRISATRVSRAGD